MTHESPPGHGQPEPDSRHYVLRLYVAGQTPRSLTAIDNLMRICREHLHQRYQVEVIDLVKNPERARGDDIVAIPTLVRGLPPPLRRLIGDLSDTDHVLAGLEIVPTDES